jgi:hypothetical protein
MYSRKAVLNIFLEFTSQPTLERLEKLEVLQKPENKMLTQKLNEGKSTLIFGLGN